MKPEHVLAPSLPSDPACGHRKDKVDLVPIAEKILNTQLTEEEQEIVDETRRDMYFERKALGVSLTEEKK